MLPRRAHAPLLLLLALGLALLAPAGFAGSDESPATPVAAEGIPDLLPPAAHPVAIQGCRCFAAGTTPSDVPLSWGMGADCTAATADLDAHTQQLADELCLEAGTEGACGFGALQISTACYAISGGYQVDGYRTYKCLSCWEIDP